MRATPAIRLEGGLFGPDILEALEQGSLKGQKPQDFGLESRRNLTDEIAAAFADARDQWTLFQRRLERLPVDDLATTATRDAWVIPFLGLLGFELTYNPKAYEVDGLSFFISHRAGPAADGPPIHIVGARQELGRVAPSGRPRLSPHALVQEYLNRTEHLWGLVTNGLTLRLLRDSTFVRRQAYAEFDLTAIFEEQRFGDFALLYRLLHRSRLPKDQADAKFCLLESYYAQSVEQGGRVRDRLRDGVEECLQLLANGFLSHEANVELRRRVAPGYEQPDRIRPEDLYRQLLRIVYRFLFLLVSEERGLLSSDPLYRGHYGILRLRRLLGPRSAWDDYDDLWHSLRLLWRVFRDERLCALLKVAPLNGELFAPVALDAFSISNRHLLGAFHPLSEYRESPSAPPRRVNYAALDVEELGSVYESLLEYHPSIESDTPGHPRFSLVFGSDRKTTGSYYTPKELVAELIQSALNPVLKERLRNAGSDDEKRKAILSLRVCDPACGSGHFLLAASRRLGKELARATTGEDEPSPEALREATREVIAHCIYGVDKNPLAVELCRVALWLESHTGGKPLTFLDHRIRPGDSLLGVFDLSTLKEGIPDKAFEALAGDDKSAAKEALRHNRQERERRQSGLPFDPTASIKSFSEASHSVAAIPDDSPDSIRAKKAAYEKTQADPDWLRRKQACDLWTAAFFQPLRNDAPVITSGVLADHLAGRSLDARLLGTAAVITERERFFHWPLEFPEVFATGGFDVVLSNPPWEHVELKEQEFFIARDVQIATAGTAAARKRLIASLQNENPLLFSAYVEHLRTFDASRGFLAHSGRFPLTGCGRINTYAVFSELSRHLLQRDSRAGIIVPTGIATDDTTKYFFQDIVTSGSLASLYDFENRKGIFPSVHKSYKFCLLTLRGIGGANTPARYVFFALSPEDLRKPEKAFALTAEEIALLNPNTGNCPIFRSQADAELTKAIYRRVPVLWREAKHEQLEANPWKLRFSQGLFNMSSDSHHFKTAEELTGHGYRLEGNVFVSPYDRYLPLYEAKMIHQFDHRWATYVDGEETRDVTPEEKADPAFLVQPRYWVREEVVESAIPKYPEPLAAAVLLEDASAMQGVLALWAAGAQMIAGEEDEAQRLLAVARGRPLPREVAKALGTGSLEERARELAQDFPLTLSDLDRISMEWDCPQILANELIKRSSPKWFLGWRDITNATNERTLIASAVPRVAVGHTASLAFAPGIGARELPLLAATMNSLVVDYSARQKVGGTHITYNLIKQFPILPVQYWLSGNEAPFGAHVEAILKRAMELVLTANDMAPVAESPGAAGFPFGWDETRRDEIRSELDAFFFHLYLPSTHEGAWRPTRTADGNVVNETEEELGSLRAHFPEPREAVAYILDQFPILRQKDEASFGSYRTKERILALYDDMQEARRCGHPWSSSLSPAPGKR